jgi:1-acyl-sn-glycerol-3-phosphate acyltransferase
MRALAREIVQVWFREVDVVDDENIPSEGGVVFIAWHPSGLIDPMLMMATLPGKMSLIAKHTLFKVPVLGTLMRASGALPIMRSSDVKGDGTDSKYDNADQLFSVAEAVARGGKLIIFPEGTTHSESDVKRVRTGAARIMEMAIELSEDEGRTPPSLIPVGLHYSEAHTFRERAAVIIERPMDLPSLPEQSGDPEADESERRTWVKEVTSDIENELKRASHATSSWQDRHLIWRARSIVHAERSRASEDGISKPTCSQSSGS